MRDRGLFAAPELPTQYTTVSGEIRDIDSGARPKRR